MVEFSRYVDIAYSVAKSKRWYDTEMRGEGTRPVHNQFMSELADTYNRLDHDRASEAAARRFLEENVARP